MSTTAPPEAGPPAAAAAASSGPAGAAPASAAPHFYIGSDAGSAEERPQTEPQSMRGAYIEEFNAAEEAREAALSRPADPPVPANAASEEWVELEGDAGNPNAPTADDPWRGLR